jgi:hypothetical protein
VKANHPANFGLRGAGAIQLARHTHLIFRYLRDVSRVPDST